MVKSLTLAKSKYFLKRELFLAITMIVVVFSFLSNFAFAAEMKINEQEVERIKTALSIVQTASNIGGVLVDGGNLKTVLNTVISGGQTATNVTYGLLVLSAINEMEFMDMVLSQSYKDEARGYFNQILDERTDLRSYWKGVGFDIPKVAGGRIASPASALTLNTFEITDKTIQIITAFNVLQKERQYDGLWYYFDFRRGGDSHEEAWELAEAQMGFAAKKTTYLGTGQNKKENDTQLEDQFLALYEKWGPYATPYGISKEYKEQLASELRNTLAAAIEENTDARPLYAKESSLWDRFSAQLASIKDALANLISQANPLKAGPVVELPSDIPAKPISGEEISGEDSPLQASETREDLEDLDDLLEEIDALNQEIQETREELAEAELPPVEPETTPEPALETEQVAITTEPEIAESAPTTTEATMDMKEVRLPSRLPSIELCQRRMAGVARQYRVLINEVAWMGDEESPNNKWIELKNIWGMPVNMAGWSLQDKDQQIKVIFGENDAIPASGYFLLEHGKNYTGALNNSDEALYLFDNNCQLEDEVIATPNWPARDNASKKPMQRFDTLYWYTGVATVGAENSSPPAILAHPSAPASPKPVSLKPNYPKILITESRLGSPGNQKDDFVELYNPNSEAVGLNDWYIQRKTEGGQDFSSYAPNGLFSGKIIEANGYFLIANAFTSLSAGLVDATTTYPLTENNTLALKDPNGEIVDEVSTDSPLVPKSFGRKWSSSTENYIDTDFLDDFEVQDPTPRAQNQTSEGGGGGGGAQALSVVINEIAWMGTKADLTGDEWVELYNNTTSSINLAGWRLAADDGGPDITFPASTIATSSYFLIERTDDNTVSDISADWFGSFGSGLNNSGENLKLYDNLGNLIDSIDASSGWPAGQALPNYISMERINSTSTATSTNWASNNRITRNGLDADGNLINGTPKAQNSVSKLFTEISWTIIFNEDITLTRFGSPYILNGGTLEVMPDVTLTLGPGTVIKFNSGTKMLVHGNLLVQGEEASPVIFTSITDSDPENNGTYYIYLDSPDSSSILDNIIVRYGGYYINDVAGYRAALTIENAFSTISNSVIENNFFVGVYLMNSNSTIQNTTFRDNKVKYSDWGSGAYSRGLSVYNSEPNLSGLYFERNYWGVYVEGDCPDLLSDITFGTSTDANTFDVFPESCEP